MSSHEAHPSLDDVCTFIVDCLHKTAPTQEDGYPLIRTPNIGKGRLLLDGVYRISEQTYETWTQRAVPEPNDLILAREAPAGNVAIVREGERVALGQRTVHLRPDPSKIDPSFLCYFLLAPNQQGDLLANETGATAKHINMKDIRRLKLKNTPEMSTQKKVASILSKYDDLIENNCRRIRLLEDTARLMYKEWFVYLRYPGHEHVDIIDGTPQGWSNPRIGEILTLNYGKALKADERIEGNFPVYGSSGVVGTHNKSLVAGPGIIVGRKGNVGAIYWSTKDYWPIDTVYFISKEDSNLYLYYALQYAQFINTDVAVPGLNRDMAYSRKILIPTNSVLNEFLDEVHPIRAQIEKLEEINTKLSAARDLLLPRLMNGDITV